MTAFKVGDRVEIIDGMWTELPVGTVGTIAEVDQDDAAYPYKVVAENSPGNPDWIVKQFDWVSEYGLKLVSVTDIADVPQLDLQTVQHIYEYYTEIIQEANVAGKSHEAISIALLGYLKGLKAGLSNG